MEIGPLSFLPADVVSVTFPVNLVKCYGAECFNCKMFKHSQPSSKNIIPSTLMPGKIIY
jgi:hypothetical protein